ncbi:hypothetical protein G6F37_012133 [Rhizopus arrhizus]|nr:hypothetical protein G6F38_012006 [Rhizopus arrhizus]KAG1145504.1 hypothetical protein G6F37_012133 [Rhizopus arrhizus]
MEDILTDISDSNVVLETVASQESCLSLKPAEKEITAKDMTKRAVEVVKPIDNSVYKDYDDQTREMFIDRMIEGPIERGSGIVCKRLWNKLSYCYVLVETLPRNRGDSLKKSQRNPGRSNSFTPEHEQHIQQIVFSVYNDLTMWM